MTYPELLDFVRTRMRMSHVYQPVMLQTLLRNGGRGSIRQVAQEILQRDESQIEYYGEITKNMVGRVLRSHHVVARDRDDFVLLDFSSFTPEQIAELIDACQLRLDQYQQERGEQVWEHRRRSSAPVSGTLRYEVLKRAAYRCELCGVAADLKALEVDHINPRNLGGGDDLENLQALCYSCNSMKRDRDDTDFRPVRATYEHRECQCVFCEMPRERLVAENALAYAIRDAYPVTALHTLVIPKRHVADYFDLTRPELNSCDTLLRRLRQGIQSADSTVAGFNVGINSGGTAGQTVPHAHVHLIPRRLHDVEHPRGGVRHVIPWKGAYELDGPPPAHSSD
jgi:ATP adenylyltransferase